MGQGASGKVKETIVEQILLKAYADSIVDSLKTREGGDTFAGFDLGEEHYDGDLYQSSVMFWWEIVASTGRFGGIGSQRTTREMSYQTVLSVNVRTGLVEIGETAEWGYIIPAFIDRSTDWISQQARKP